MISNMEVVPQSRIDLFAEMESHYETQDTEYFVKLLDHDDYVVRCRATCILVDLGGEDKVQYIAKVLKDDPNEDRKSTRLNSSHVRTSRMPSSA